MKTVFTTLLLLVIGSVPAWAALGQYESSVSLDQKFIAGQDRQVVRQGYHLHEITASDGSFVREYVSPAGIVFGVSWQGHGMPNIQQLLGSYLTDFQQAQKQTVRRRSVVVRTDKFVFVSSGHLRFFQGHAYAPSLIPSNLGPEVVQ
jgi:hypothetical protein